MIYIMNQYSLLIIGGIAASIILLIMWRLVTLKYVLASIGLLSVLLISSQVFLRTSSNTFSSVESFNSALASGKPVLLELYSNF